MIDFRQRILALSPGKRERLSLRLKQPGGSKQGGEKRLVAYIVSRPGQAPTVGDLRGFLKHKLPDYMVPSDFVFLDALPLTPNGKIDRKALPAPDQTGTAVEKSFVAPRGSLDALLARIWAEVLQLHRVGINDNFFELGGHSLVAIQVISRLRNAIQMEIPVRWLFEAPTIAGLAGLVEQARTTAQKPHAPSPLPIRRDGALPLSFGQQRIWFLDQLKPGSSVYTEPVALRLRGPLDGAALESSLNEIVRRHEALRTTFTTVEGHPAQVVAPSLTVILPVTDLREFPETERYAQAQRLAAEEAHRPFDLARGPLVRAGLLRLTEEDHILLVTMHHIVTDAWSERVLLRELSVLYDAFSTGRPSPLPALGIQYADYAHWQREWLQGEMLEMQLSYWKKQLDGVPPMLALPTDRPRPATQTHRGASESRVIDQEVFQALKALSQAEGLSLFMTLLAAFKLLLCRYTGQDDIVVGSPIAGRNDREVEGLIGFFLNTLVLRTDLSGDPTFTELLRRVREVALGAYAHQELPFEKLLEELKLERDLSHTPLFQVFFNMHNFPDDRLALPGITAEPLPVSRIVSHFDLTLYVVDHAEGIKLILVYNADLFEAATTARMLGHYETLLKDVAANPERSISSLSLLTKEERAERSSRTNVIRPSNPFIEFRKEQIEQSISSRFERQVEQYPDHFAVRTKTHQWTYRELNRNANRLAQSLLWACGSGEERVGLLLDHEAPTIAAILGVLKAGKSYVPLDSTYPKERLSYMLEDSQAEVLITNNRNMASAASLIGGGLKLVNIDEPRIGESIANPDVDVSPDAPAYLLYTSGSTGRPKGVLQNHRNVLHFIRAYTNSLHLAADDRLTLFSSYSHDAAVVDIFAALANGATLCIWSVKEDGVDGIAEWLTDEAVTVYHSTPTLYRNFVDGLDRSVRFPKVRAVVLGGEAVSGNDFSRFQDHFHRGCIFFNLYGSTESSINLLYAVNGETYRAGSIFPVGYPVEDTEVLLLDEAGREAQMCGEIAIRSAHLAPGYWRKPEMTQAAFLPVGEGDPPRIYRTGDMGRWLSDGTIAPTGRRDFQVKLRGFRIEPGEIETILEKHPAIREAVVIAAEDVSGEKRLTAYVVRRSGEPITVDAIRAFLKQKLPDYMVPSAYLLLEAFPLTPNGKVNRRALPSPDHGGEDLQRTFVAPRTPTEEALARIWSQVLKLDRVGVSDNFFDIGGHSLLAAQVVSRMRADFKIDVSLRLIFERPTVEELALEIEEALLAEIESAAV